MTKTTHILLTAGFLAITAAIYGMAGVTPASCDTSCPDGSSATCPTCRPDQSCICNCNGAGQSKAQCYCG